MRVQRTVLIAITWAVGLGVAPAEAEDGPTGSTEDAQLAARFRDYLGAWFLVRPLAASHLGDHRFDDRLDDVSPAGRAAERTLYQNTLAQLAREVDAERLSQDGRIDLDIWKTHLANALWLAETFRPDEDDPLTYAEPLLSSVSSLLTATVPPREQALHNAEVRMAHVPAVVAAAKAALKRPPAERTDAAIRHAESALAFYRDGVYALARQPRGAGGFGQRAVEAATALEQYLRFLKDELRPRSTGEWRIGRDRFRAKFERVLDTGLTADAVVAEAEREADRVEREMAVIARQMWGKWFPDDPLPTEDEAGRRALIRRVLDTIGSDHSTRATFAADVRATIGEVRTFIAQHGLLLLPNPDRCQVVEIAASTGHDAVAYFGPTPVFDSAQVPTYLVNPPPTDWPPAWVTSYFEEHNRSMLKVVTMHETYPGHYVQFAHAEHHPSLIRRVLASDTFVEGWAVYSEQMMLDQGFGGGDLAIRLCQLKFYLRSVMNTILDYRRHAEGMTDEQAKTFLMGRAFQSEGEAVRKVERSKLSACQLSTYFAGRMGLHRLRQDIQRSQGPRFHLGRFHEAVLSHGAVPVRHLPALVKDP